ncbi:unnamed protein product [Brachionus calyciflorus]|uniref:Uncharacterized protein n=1 Tax=Brachionus calyciflorus TaxID=104777 RepID=A0A813XIQ6_9BILA|nr:unnamed protein product [Brachionus calyciflorus]
MLINDKSILINSKKLSQSTNNVANQVVIINQNQNNLLIDDLLNNNSLLDNGNRHQDDEDMSEIKYMKGYVNVLKERFTRKSLGNTNNNNNNNNSENLNESLQKNRLSLTNNLEINNRRRSVSPFVSSNTTPPSIKYPSKEPKNKLFSSQDDLRNSNKLQIQKPTMNKNLSHSNLLDDQQSIVKCTYLNEINKDELPKPNFVSSVKNLFEKQIKNDTVNNINYHNHHNVNQNLFDNIISKRDKNSMINNHHNHHHHHHQNHNNKHLIVMSTQQADNLVERLKQNGTVVYQHNHDSNQSTNQKNNLESEISHSEKQELIATNLKKDHKVQKPHYKKHLSNATNLNITGHLHPPTTNGLDKENKTDEHSSPNSGLSFKERKELFSKKQQTPNSVQNYHYHSPHQTNQIKRFKTEYTYIPNINDDESKTNSIQIELNSNNNNNNSLQENDTIETNNLTADQVLKEKQEKSKSKSTTVKMKTYYGGEEVKDLKQLNLEFVPPSQNQKPIQLNPVHQKKITQTSNNSTNNNSNNITTSIEYFNFEFIGAGVKLDKSILIVNNNTQTHNTHVQIKRTRKSSSLKVNFTDQPEMYEYPSFEFVLKEMGFDPMAEEDEDLNNQTESESQSSSTSSLSQFLPGRFSYDDAGVEADNESDSSSFSNFKPSWHKNYELGSMEHLNVKAETSSGNSVETSSTESLTNDILPTRDDEIKKWSSDMDTNILF